MKQLSITENLYQYILEVSLREDHILKELREETSKLPLAAMQIAPEQGQFIQFLLKLINAKKVLELGTFTGYSALAMALALPKDGKVITCDLNEEWTNIAHHYWRKSKQDKKIELRLGKALDTMHQLINEGKDNKFDLIFIDADKSNYLNYYKLALQLIQTGGIIIVDNALWSGKVINQNDTDSQTRGIIKLNKYIQQDQSVFPSLLPIADGLFLIQVNN